MKIKIYSLLVLAGLLLNSCSDYFDVSPKTNVEASEMFKSETGFNDVLVGAYTIMSTRNLYGDNLTYGFIDVLAQYYQGIKNINNHNFTNDVDFDYTNIKVQNRIKNIWADHYTAIANINAMLSYIDERKNVFSPGVYEVFKGEALGLRAYLHFNLLRTFGQAPILGTDSPGIPYYDEYTRFAKPADKVSAVLNKILADLEAAHDLMVSKDPYGPNHADFNALNTPTVLTNRQFRMNYYAVTTALSIVNQYAGNNDMALQYAQEVIGSADGTTKMPSDLFSLASLTQDFTANSETIFKLNISKLVTYTDIYLSAAAGSLTGQRLNWLAINTGVIDAMYSSPGAADPRSTEFFGSPISGESPVGKYIDKVNVPMLKISELYLVAAECDSNLDNALTYFNKFTASRGIPAKSGLTRTELNAEIYNEYKKEFIGEGKLFWNYKRVNAATMGPANEVQVVNPSIYTLPIPAEELEFGNL